MEARKNAKREGTHAHFDTQLSKTNFVSTMAE
jgi:hypothetical protein